MPKKSRDDAAEAIVQRGKLWGTFWGTSYGIDLMAFINEQERLGKDATAELVMAGSYEEAKAAGHKTAGILSVKQYINDAIEDGKSQIEFENTPHDPAGVIPSHV